MKARTGLLIFTLFVGGAKAFAANRNCHDFFQTAGPPVSLKVRAQMNGLNYIKNYGMGLRRVLVKPKLGKEKAVYAYFNWRGEPVTDPETVSRADALSIPPSHRDSNIWISPDPSSHIQALSVDSNNKPQYFYHEKWRALSNELKFERILRFGRVLPWIRRVGEERLNGASLSKDRVLAAITRLLETVLIRVGNVEGVRNNESFGLTTMLKSHVVEIDPPVLQFKPKSGNKDKPHRKTINDPRISQLIAELLRLPGENLFQYVDPSGKTHIISSVDVNKYIKGLTGGYFSAKDFRTWMATYYATEFLYRSERPSTNKDTEELFNKASAYASSFLGNTPKVCRESYIFPGVFEIYKNRTLFEKLIQKSLTPSLETPAIIENLVINMLSLKR